MKLHHLTPIAALLLCVACASAAQRRLTLPPVSIPPAFEDLDDQAWIDWPGWRELSGEQLREHFGGRLKRAGRRYVEAFLELSPEAQARATERMERNLEAFERAAHEPIERAVARCLEAVEAACRVVLEERAALGGLDPATLPDLSPTLTLWQDPRGVELVVRRLREGVTEESKRPICLGAYLNGELEGLLRRCEALELDDQLAVLDRLRALHFATLAGRPTLLRVGFAEVGGCTAKEARGLTGVSLAALARSFDELAASIATELGEPAESERAAMSRALLCASYRSWREAEAPSLRPVAAALDEEPDDPTWPAGVETYDRFERHLLARARELGLPHPGGLVARLRASYVEHLVALLESFAAEQAASALAVEDPLERRRRLFACLLGLQDVTQVIAG